MQRSAPQQMRCQQGLRGLAENFVARLSSYRPTPQNVCSPSGRDDSSQLCTPWKRCTRIQVRAQRNSDNSGPSIQRSTLECNYAPQLLLSDQSQTPSTDDLQDILPKLTPKQLADAIWGFAKQGLKPTEEIMHVIAQEVQSKLLHFRSQDLSNTIWALAVLNHHPEAAWWEEFERQVYNNLPDFSGRELGNLLWALALLNHRPAWVLDSVLSHASDNFESYTPNSLHLIIWSIGKLGYVPTHEWMQMFLHTAQARFFQFTPAEMANMVWGLAKLGHKLPAMWMDKFLITTQWRFPSFQAKLLSIIIWSAAMLDHEPSQEWLLKFDEQVREKFQDFNGQELACIAWALHKFGYTGERNAIFYMLERQEKFLAMDFEILSNSQLLGQVLQCRGTGAHGMPPPA